MRPLFMLTTELISIPTGFLFLVTLGTLWKAKIRFEVPMLFCLGMLFNFLIGGITGVFLSDVPVNVTVHGSFFVMAHFHYTIMGGLIFALFGGLLLLAPEDDRARQLNQQLGQGALLDVLHLLQLHLLPPLPGGPPRPAAARVRVRPQPADAERHLVDQCLPVGGFVPHLHLQLRVVGLHRPGRRPPTTRGTRRGLEWQTATPVPWYNFERIPVVLSDPYHYGEPDAPAVADLGVPIARVGRSHELGERSVRASSSRPESRATSTPVPRSCERRAPWLTTA